VALTSDTAATAIVLAGAFTGGFVSGLAGFGTGLVALGIWLHALQPAPAATLVVACSVFAQLLTLPAIRHAIRPSLVWPFVLAGLLGVPVGTALLRFLDPEAFKLGTGLLLVAFSTFLLLHRRPIRLSIGGPAPRTRRSVSRAASSAGWPACPVPCPRSGPACGAGERTRGGPSSRSSTYPSFPRRSSRTWLRD
jgi:uncharacterized membrane protein YfcA